MKELLYWSPKKLESFYLPDRKWGIFSGEVQVSALGASVRVVSPSGGMSSEVEQFSKLARVAKLLGKKSEMLPKLRWPWQVGDWFIFDCMMHYGKVGNATGQDAAVFFTSGIFQGGVFLFGDAQHLVGKAPESSQPSHHISELDWLGIEAERADDNPDYMTGEFSSPNRAWQYRSYARQALEISIRRLRWEKQLLPPMRLSGLARILLVEPHPNPLIGNNIGSRDVFGPLVVATPLYVEVGPWNPKW